MSIYFDYAATTPLDPDVLQAMMPYFNDTFGNPSSIHQAGQRAEAAVDQSRTIVAALIGADPFEITFTSGATESNNLALRGIAHQSKLTRGASRILTTAVEHPSVMQTCRQLEDLEGFTLEFLPTDNEGRVLIQGLENVLRDDTALVSVIYANNEIGTVNPIAQIGALCRDRGIPFHIDAAQAANHLDLDVNQLQIDLMTLGAHKFYGPKGAGVLYHRHQTAITPWQTGGSQEYGHRAGTHNVPAIIGFAKAFQIAREMLAEFTPRVTALRDQIIESIPQTIPDVLLSGSKEHRLANHISFTLKDIDSNQLLAALDLAGFACSSGSACKTGNPEPSPILLALGLDPHWTLGSLRISLGRASTQAQVEALVRALPTIVSRLRTKQIA